MTYLQTIATNGTITHDITPCGWDCGNGYSKLHTPEGQILIPSYFKQISESDRNDYESLGNGALIEYLQGDRTDLVGSKWLIGESAEVYFKQSFGRIVDDLKNKITYGLQMLLGAIALTPRQQNYNLLIVASLHDSQAFAPDLKKALQGQHTVKFDGKDIVNICVNCQIVEEGVGGLLISRAPGQQKVAPIDLGHGTTITSVFEGNKLLQNSRKIDTVGVYHLCESISNNLQTRRHLGKPANPHLIREGMTKTRWNEAIQQLSSKASIISRLLLNEVPENIEDTFSHLGLHLLPHSSKDFKTKCSCPDYANPCKHIAGVYYLVASQLDNNPWLLFELRGLSKAELQAKLADSPLGKALSEELNTKEIPLELSNSLYTKLEKQSLNQMPNAREFWLGTKRLPQTIEVAAPGSICAILIKKQGDFPDFWHNDASFIETMEELYQRVKTKNHQF